MNLHGGEYWCDKLECRIYSEFEFNKRFRDNCEHFQDRGYPDKLRPLHGSIQIKYSIMNSGFGYSEKRAVFNTYEDFGEWLCRQFDKIKILDISDK